MALRNVIHRRNHKERAQPGHRRKLGLLEKHKDYVERARDHHSKQERLQRLQQKAALRNPDEFNFGMIKGAPADLFRRAGRHVERRTSADARPLPNDLVAILKSQDLGYIRSAIRSEAKKVEQLKERIRPGLGMLPIEWLDEKEGRREILSQQGLLQPTKVKTSSTIAAGGKKTVWVDSMEEARKMRMADAATARKGKGKAKDDGMSYSLDDDMDHSLSGLSSSDEDEDQFVEATDAQKAKKQMSGLVKELGSRQQRLDALNEARSKLEVVRNLMTTKGTSARKIQSKEQALRDVVSRGARVTSNGLALPGPDEEESEDEGPLGSTGGGVKAKKTIWKWGRERKK